MNNRKILAFMLSVTLTTLATAVSSKVVKIASGQVTRTSGSDRYQTAAQVATSNWTTSDNVDT
ncbi:hypothetical protein [Clostridium sp. DJ247]|uniref:hypothetical protein n=1 Tax=Clostridium sp. DJ247 TaxID=2726188 RepID=UPI00162747DE|nr:hypothetical protein [Clostridium sp. DJ247]MBC2580382.1 cell wall-binding repeat-containing protein [Clostridium sp. DJ247]